MISVNGSGSFGEEFLLPTYDRLGVKFDRGEGLYLHDREGNRYLDALAGIAVNILGYRHPRLVEAAREASDDIHHLSNLFEIESQTRLAEQLSEMTFGTRAFFCNSGAEAIEAAIKFSRKYSRRFGNGAYRILAAENSFHGRTMGALAATGQSKYQTGFEPLPEGFEHVPYNNGDVLSERMNDDVCAVLVEPIQGEGGIIPGTRPYFERIRDLCDHHDSLLIVDEIQSGMGRSGQFLAVNHLGVRPDLVTLAKGLAGGFPIGAMLADRSLEPGLQAGDHASTFGGNPFACQMALTVLECIKKENLIELSDKRGRYLNERLTSLADSLERVGTPRGRGLMHGLPLEQPLDASRILKKALEKHLIVGTAGENTLRFVPPLVITRREIDRLTERLEEVLREELKKEC